MIYVMQILELIKICDDLTNLRDSSFFQEWWNINGYKILPRLQVLIRVFINEVHTYAHGPIKNGLVQFEQVHDKAPSDHVSDFKPIKEGFLFKNLVHFHVNSFKDAGHQVVGKLPIYLQHLFSLVNKVHLRSCETRQETYVG